ncbi:MAG: type VI secretion system-associated FHA domain protein TagH [Pseudomonadota bacterium]
MIKLTVQTYNGTPLPQPLSAQFDELGGSIGRADTNQLVLPDPERSISRVHAQVVFRNGAYALVDRGSNPVLVNGRSLGNGVESPLSAGDQLQIGGYAIRVDVLAGGASAGAHAGGGAGDPFGDLGGMAFAAPAPSAPRPAAGGFGGAPAGGGRPPAGGAGSASTDPMAAFGFGGGFGAPAAPAPASAAPAAGGIPDDWDPFAPDPVSAPKPQDLARSLGQGNSLGLELGGGANAPLIPGMGDLGGGKANTSSSIDAMFGLGGGGGDPLANSVLAQASAQPNMANHLDPMKSLNTVSVASATVAPDNVSALNQPFMEPPLKVNAPKAAPAVPVPPVPPAAGGAGSAVMSWDDGAQEGRTVIRSKSKLGDFDSFGTMGGTKPAAPAPARPAAPTQAPMAAPASAGLDPLALLGGGGAAPTPSGGGVLDPLDFSDLGMGGGGSAASPLNDLLGGAAPAPVQAPAPVAAPVAPPIAAPAVATPVAQPVAAVAPVSVAPASVAPGTPADQAALIAALREGLGMSTLPIQSLTPEFMKLLGQLVHESTKGTVELLVARAALKREIRAEVTMIVAKENNPLKFSPSVDVALNHLLSPPARGFMPPAPAMRDAYDDLRAHQFAFVAGMRAALEGVLKRFDPEVLEGKLTQKSVLASVLPGARKARMWDVFTELYSQISAEASDDFHELFGKEFLRAYEAHIDELQRDA